ncbi:hypothetical protein [Streptomyces yaizuensis]|uniref:Uncharacterized protein n=1 Tax=Streptomyces yaizuensis TaxID=2989713 RepID=A0ABQ5NX94_9ACTN|nr:hypothetical protein [Streptomyces sp. YSPA8]GLF94778.1 hypothetical protein SYYSPA8_10795 [Streptomyces sp. YSPA8]
MEQPPAPGRIGQYGNGVVLDHGLPVEERVARVAEWWDADSRDGRWLVTGKAYFLLRCWLLARAGALPSGVGGYAADYAAACLSVNGGEPGWDRALRARLSCPGCGDGYRAENMRICVTCADYTCCSCEPDTHARECEVVG